MWKSKYTKITKTILKRKSKEEELAMRKDFFGMICLLLLTSVLFGCGSAAQTNDGYRGIDVVSPDWVG